MRKIELIDSTTGQKEEVFVNYFVDPSKADVVRGFSWHDLLIILAFGILLFLIFYVFKGNSDNQFQFRRPAPYVPRPISSIPQPRIQQTPGFLGSAAPASTPGSTAARKMGYRHF